MTQESHEWERFGAKLSGLGKLHNAAGLSSVSRLLVLAEPESKPAIGLLKARTKGGTAD